MDWFTLILGIVPGVFIGLVVTQDGRDLLRRAWGGIAALRKRP